MNFLKKINHYLLINHPVLWRTKVHYFVIFSLILGNVAAFSLGYFPIKWYGANSLGVGFFLVQNLAIFVVLAWLITQARNKIKYYNFWDEVLTFSIYVLCTMSLFGNLMLFERTRIHTEANLISVEQIDIDKELIRDKREIDRRKYYSENHVPRSFPPQDIVDEMAERYKIDKSYQHAEIPVKVNEISKKVSSIYNSQLDLNMRQASVPMCGVGEGMIRYLPLILIALFIPILLFLISHTRLFTVLGIAAIFFFLITFGSMLISVVLGGGVAYMTLYLLLGLGAIYGVGKVYRFAILFIIPYTLIVAFLSSMSLLNYTNNETYQLTLSVLFTIIITVFSSAFFIKRYFEPTA